MSEKTEAEKAAEAKAAEDKKVADEKALAEAKAKAAPKTKVRVIVDQGRHKVNDVVSLAPDEAKAAVAAGWADDHPSAVKYAEGLKKHAPAPVAEIAE